MESAFDKTELFKKNIESFINLKTEMPENRREISEIQRDISKKIKTISEN